MSGDPLAPKPLAEETTVVVGIGKQLEVYAQFLMAEAEGEFAKENLKVEIQDVPESDKLALISQGRMDLGYNALTAGLLNLMSTGAGVKWAFPALGMRPSRSRVSGSTRPHSVRTDPSLPNCAERRFSPRPVTPVSRRTTCGSGCTRTTRP
ncbi:hypothetical protein P9209_01075 [Prescottella defluvii]|nr:hypothetical protein P9209_01075 [Prescottella defluvii]